MIFIWILLVLAAVWLFMIMPRLRRPAALKELKQYRYAHRGLHNIKKGVPENSLLAFELAVQQGYGIELDIHLSLDGKLVVEHDDTLQRTCGDPRVIEQCNWQDLKGLRLEGTDQHLPLLEEVFALVNGKVPLLIEAKAVGGNQPALAAAICRALKEYHGPYCVESFDPRVLLAMRKIAPTIVRGQLGGHVRTEASNVSAAINFALKNLLVNLLSRPDFIAYRYQDHKNISFRICRSLFHAPVFFWTVRSVEGENLTAKYKAAPIFEKIE